MNNLMNQQTLHLVTHVLCPYVQRSIIVLLEKEIPYTRTDIDLSNTPAWFRRLSPMDRVPLLLVNENNALFESAVICEYLNEITPGSLHPKDPLEKAHHRSWIEFGSNILDSIGGLYHAKDAASFKNKQVELQKKFQSIESEIGGSSFFSGDKFQLIDAVYGPIFRYFDVFDQIVDLAIFENLSKTNAWRHALQQRVSVQHAVAPEYPQWLLQFLKEQDSYISRNTSTKIRDLFGLSNTRFNHTP